MQAGGREFESLYLHFLVSDSIIKCLTKTKKMFIIEWLSKTARCKNAYIECTLKISHGREIINYVDLNLRYIILDIEIYVSISKRTKKRINNLGYES